MLRRLAVHNQIFLRTQSFKVTSISLFNTSRYFYSSLDSNSSIQNHAIKGVKGNDVETGDVVNKIRVDFNKPLTSAAIANELYDLRHMRDTSVIDIGLIKGLQSSVEACEDSWTCEDLHRALTGVQSLPLTHPANRSLLYALSLKVNNVTGPIDVVLIVQALNALRNMKGDHMETRALLQPLASLLDAGLNQLDTRRSISVRDACTVISSVRMMDGLCDEVQYALSVVTSAEWEGSLGTNEFLATLRNMSRLPSESSCVQQVLTKLVSAVKISDTEDKNEKVVPALKVYDAMRGLSRMSSSHEPVRAALGTLCRLLDMAPVVSNRATVLKCAEALYSMRHMDCDSAEVSQLLCHIHEVLKSVSRPPERRSAVAESDSTSSVVTLPLTACCQALSGLRMMDSRGFEVRNLLVDLSYSLREEGRTGIAKRAAFGKGSHLTGRDVTLAAEGLQNKSCEHVEVRMVLGALAGRIQSMGGWFNGRDPTENPPREPLTQSGLESVLRCLYFMDASRPVVLKMVEYVTAHLRNRTSVPPLSGERASRILTGLTWMSSDYPEVLNLLNAFLSNLSHGKGGGWTEREVCLALSSLGSMSSRSGEIQGLLRILAHKMKSRDRLNDVNPLEVTDIALAIGGMRSMNSEHDEVTTLLSILTGRLECILSQEGAQLTGDDLSLIMTGLCNMSSDHKEVRKVIKILSLAMRNTSLELSSTCFIDILYGMRGFGSECYEVRAFIRCVLSLMAQPENQSALVGIKPGMIAKLLTGIRGLANEVTSDKRERAEPVVELVNMLTDVVLAVNGTFRTKDLCIALQGLQRLESWPQGHEYFCQATVDLVDALVARMANEKKTSSVLPLELAHRSRALYGLAGIADTASPCIFSLKVQLLDDIGALLKRVPISRIEEVQHTLQVMNFYIARDRDHVSDTVGNRAIECRKVALKTLNQWQRELTNNGKKNDSDSQTSSFIERRFRKEFDDVLSAINAGVEAGKKWPDGGEDVPPVMLDMSANEMLGGFESDVVIRVRRKYDNKAVLTHNIQIDGPHHMIPHKRRFAELRDKYLLSPEMKKNEGVDVTVSRVLMTDNKEVLNRQRRQDIVQQEIQVLADAVRKTYTSDS